MWDPIRNFVTNEWYRDEEVYDNMNTNPTRTRFRRDEEVATDDANDASSSSGSANNGSDSSTVEYERDIASDIRVALFFHFYYF